MDANTNAMLIGDQPSRPRRNWWKAGFFIALGCFELTRELLILNEAQGATPNTTAHVFSYDGYVNVEGSWKRIDGGGSLVPSTVTIECRRETGQCLEASVMIHDEYVYAPDLSYFKATFTPGTVSYINDLPGCAKYSVRIDLEMRKAFAVRQRKPNSTNKNCKLLENRIEMQIADGYDTHMDQHDPLKGHFVPIIKLLKLFFD